MRRCTSISLFHIYVEHLLCTNIVVICSMFYACYVFFMCESCLVHVFLVCLVYCGRVCFVILHVWFMYFVCFLRVFFLYIIFVLCMLYVYGLMCTPMIIVC